MFVASEGRFERKARQMCTQTQLDLFRYSSTGYLSNHRIPTNLGLRSPPSYAKLCNMFKIWSLFGVKNAWATHIMVSFSSLFQNFRRASLPLDMQSSPPPPLPPTPGRGAEISRSVLLISRANSLALERRL